MKEKVFQLTKNHKELNKTKKLIIAVCLIAVFMLFSACGKDADDGESKIKETSSSQITTNKVENGEVSIDDEGMENSAEMMTIFAYQDDMLFGASSVEDDYVAMNFDGKFLFYFDDEGVKFPADKKEISLFNGDYAALNNNTVIDKTGRVVFDIANTEFNEIYYSGCLDVGYILCSKDVNTFEETGKHYYAVKIPEGTSFKYDNADVAPKADDYWFYFGKGYFVRALPNSGFPVEQTVYNLITNTSYAVSGTDAAGNSVNQFAPLYFMDTKDIVEPYLSSTDENVFYFYHSDIYEGKIMKYDLENGIVTDRFAAEGTEYDNIVIEGATLISNVKKAEASVTIDGNYTKTKYLFDRNTLIFTPMADYTAFNVYKQNVDGSYFAVVENEGGGKFLAVIEPDGTRRFDPVAVKEYVDCNNDYIVVKTDSVISEGNYDTQIYDWNGNHVKTLYNDSYNKLILGDSGVLIRCRSEEKPSELLYILYNFKTGTEVNISDKYSMSNIAEGFETFYNGYYITDNAILDETGNITAMNIK